MIRVQGLTKDYGSRRAIDDLTFDARKGEILGFLGPNGAGKTTTMRILTGYLPPSSGKVEIGGFDVVDQSMEARRLIGYLPETVPLYLEMSVYEYLDFMAQLRRVPNRDDRIEEVIEQVHLEERAFGSIEKLSKGMRQRVGLAQALLHQPEVLILDEPTIGLDPVQIIEVRNLIRELGKERTVLLSTHILSEAQQVCNRVLIINKGKIIAEDTPGHLQARLTGASHILVRINGEVAEAMEIVEKIPGVTRVSISNENSLDVEASPGVDARPAIARAIVNQGLDLLEMQATNLSLEDIFLQLTRDDAIEPQLSTIDEGEDANA